MSLCKEIRKSLSKSKSKSKDNKKVKDDQKRKKSTKGTHDYKSKNIIKR